MQEENVENPNVFNAFRALALGFHSAVFRESRVAECTIDELMVVHSVSGVTNAFSLKGDDLEANKSIQAEIRRNAEAFLSRRIIICEGKTEIGFIRAVDRYIASTKIIVWHIKE